MIFKDISNYNNVNDYLPILNGCLNAVLCLIFFVYHGVYKSKHLSEWYKKYQLNAVLADVLIFFIGIIITRFLYKYLFKTFSIIKFSLLAIFIQIIHDVGFYYMFTLIPRNMNSMIDFYKNTYKKLGFVSLLWNIFIMLFSCLLGSFFATMNLNDNIITIIFTLYFIPYLVNYK
jgi:uncharacterized protein YacL